MGNVFAGGCQCGAVRFRAEGPVESAVLCHCRTCRRIAGAPTVAWITVPARGFAFTAGTPTRYASSPGVERTHCATCGTGLTFQDRDGAIDIATATLDDPEAVPPRHEIWVSHRLSWTSLSPTLPRHETGSGD